MPEAWLRGPVEDVPPLLMPVAHSLIDALEDIEQAVLGLRLEEVWLQPGGAASIGFHLRHVAGSIDRLLTYSRGEMLSEVQLAALREEGVPGEPPTMLSELLDGARRAVGMAFERIRETTEDQLLEPRKVGRAGLPSTVQGLLFHIAEHTRRHAGQIVATAKIVRGLDLAGVRGEPGGG